MIRQFRKKPVTVEAVQFTGNNWAEVYELTDRVAFAPVDDEEDRKDDPEIVAKVYDRLHSTWVGVKVGQWIIWGVAGEFYPCDPEVFDATYDPA